MVGVCHQQQLDGKPVSGSQPPCLLALYLEHIRHGKSGNGFQDTDIFTHFGIHCPEQEAVFSKRESGRGGFNRHSDKPKKRFMEV